MRSKGAVEGVRASGKRRRERLEVGVERRCSQARCERPLGHGGDERIEPVQRALEGDGVTRGRDDRPDAEGRGDELRKAFDVDDHVRPLGGAERLRRLAEGQFRRVIVLDDEELKPAGDGQELGTPRG